MACDFFTFMRGVGEFTAMTLIMLIGCMGCAIHAKDANTSIISSVHSGLVLIIIMHIFGFVSGAHANPCISIACCVIGYIPIEMMSLYIASQMAGAGFGYFILMQILPQDVIDGSKPAVCMTEPMGSLSNSQIMIIEGILTAVLVFGWCALWDIRNSRYIDSVTLRMGCLVTACSLAGYELTGANLNPAKTLIPALFNGNADQVMLQLGGQIIAAVVVPYSWSNFFTSFTHSRLLPLHIGQNVESSLLMNE